MSRSEKPPLNLRLNRGAKRSIKKSGPVNLHQSVSDSPRAVKMADRLIIACRENVRFLNFHLRKYEKFLELPFLVDNALYLAYTIRLRDGSPYDALSIRRHLAEAGIETSPAFSFAAAPEDNYAGPAINRIRESNPNNDLDSGAFCLGCHQYLTILDLEHIIETFDAIFGHLVNERPPDAEDTSLRGND